MWKFSIRPKSNSFATRRYWRLKKGHQRGKGSENRRGFCRVRRVKCRRAGYVNSQNDLTFKFSHWTTTFNISNIPTVTAHSQCVYLRVVYSMSCDCNENFHVRIVIYGVESITCPNQINVAILFGNGQANCWMQRLTARFLHSFDTQLMSVQYSIVSSAMSCCVAVVWVMNYEPEAH